MSAHLKSSNTWWRHQMENILSVTGPLWAESIGDRWILLTMSSDVELWCFLLLNGWANSRDAGDLRRHRAHYDVTVIQSTQHGHCRLLAIDRTSISCLSSNYNSFEDWLSADAFYGFPILKWVAQDSWCSWNMKYKYEYASFHWLDLKIGYPFSSPCKDRQGDVFLSID